MSTTRKINTYLKYGVSIEQANKFLSLELSKTTFENLSNKILQTKFGLDITEIKIVKDKIKRKPISEDVIQKLLENSSYTCCICKGSKSDAYIIHHIDFHSETQDNTYENLAVLCPNDHELAHKMGKSLAMNLTPKQIVYSKYKWEEEVKAIRIEKASLNGDIKEIEFLNVPRILELCTELFQEIPKTKHTESLVYDKLIKDDGYLNIDYIKTIASNPNTPLMFFGPLGSTKLKSHYHEIFKLLLKRVTFNNLENLLNAQKIKEGIEGKYCYYCGGVYGKKYDSEDTDIVRFHLKKKKFIVEWLVDPTYLVSKSALARTSQRNTYILYGKIMSIDFTKRNEKTYIKIDVRPYCYGLPKEARDRTPEIAFKKEMEKLLNEEDEHGFNIDELDKLR